jgi:hypothetical protein
MLVATYMYTRVYLVLVFIVIVTYYILHIILLNTSASNLL